MIILRLLSWVAGALGILNLIKDLRLINIQGILSVWIENYNELTKLIFHLLVGWINIPMFHISHIERHAIVLACLLNSTYLKTFILDEFTRQEKKAKERNEALPPRDKRAENIEFMRLFAAIMIGVMAFFILIAGFIPDEVGSLFISMLSLFPIVMLIGGLDAISEVAQFFRNLVGTVSVVILLILANSLLVGDWKAQ